MRKTYRYVLLAELSIGFSLQPASGTPSELNYGHTLILQSLPTSFDVESCMELIFTAQCPFSVKLVCLTFNGTYNKLPLYSSRQPLGITPHKLKVALPVTTFDYQRCALEFQVFTMTAGLLGAVTSIAVTPGQCPPPG